MCHKWIRGGQKRILNETYACGLSKIAITIETQHASAANKGTTCYIYSSIVLSIANYGYGHAR